MSDVPPRRSPSTFAAVLLGLAMAVAALAAFHFGPLRHTPAFRYVEFPSQWVEVAFFGVGLGAILLRLRIVWRESSAAACDLLPRWDGKPVAPEKAADLLTALRRQPGRLQDSMLGRRLAALLGFVGQRKSSAGLDDQMRALADGDALRHDAGLGFMRFVIWAIPILGFLGTVVGITGAIGGASAEKLEANMSEMTSGLAEAFDATALALGLTMTLMFLNFLVERKEQAVLTAVDDETENLLAHRFTSETAGADMSVAAALRDQAQAIASLAGGPVAQAASVFDAIQQRVVGTLAEALDATLTQHAQRLGSLEQQAVAQSAQLMQQLTHLAAAVRDTGRQQQDALMEVARAIAGQAAALGKLQEGEANLVHLQAVLHQNLAALASASSFEQAVHSLTAAAHLLTARVTPPGPRLSSYGNAA